MGAASSACTGHRSQGNNVYFLEFWPIPSSDMYILIPYAGQPDDTANVQSYKSRNLVLKRILV